VKNTGDLADGAVALDQIVRRNPGSEVGRMHGLPPFGIAWPNGPGRPGPDAGTPPVIRRREQALEVLSG
jgi:hypothetical protein